MGFYFMKNNEIIIQRISKLKKKKKKMYFDILSILSLKNHSVYKTLDVNITLIIINTSYYLTIVLLLNFLFIILFKKMLQS